MRGLRIRYYVMCRKKHRIVALETCSSCPSFNGIQSSKEENLPAILMCDYKAKPKGVIICPHCSKEIKI